MNAPQSLPFKARASQLGAYFACDFRAGLDRARAEGSLVLDIVDKMSPYGCFGTVTHYVLQTMLGATFPPLAEGETHEPSTEENFTAATLFRGDPTAMEKHAKAVASLAAAHMPKIDGTWLAEPAFETADLTGHIDFLSPDGKIIVDLKTTQRKPDHNRIKPGHLYQLMAYRKLVQAKYGKSPEMGYVLYVDAKNAKWALLLPFDFAAESAVDMDRIVSQYLAYLQSPTLLKNAVPRLGNTCAGDYCPYVGMCRDAYIPPSGDVQVTDDVAAMPTSGEVF